jgi:DNA-3-methyladenine glycosylase I
MSEIRPLSDDDRPWALEFQSASWRGSSVARRGELVDLDGLPGFVAMDGGERVGLVSYAIRGDQCEVVTLESLREGQGVGRALLEAVCDAAREAGSRRLWLVTTNDNTEALRFYQRCGLDIAEFRRDAVTEARRTLKPTISELGASGIPIRHELELELLL